MLKTPAFRLSSAGPVRAMTTVPKFRLADRHHHARCGRSRCRHPGRLSRENATTAWLALFDNGRLLELCQESPQRDPSPSAVHGSGRHPERHLWPIPQDPGVRASLSSFGATMPAGMVVALKLTSVSTKSLPHGVLQRRPRSRTCHLRRDFVGHHRAIDQNFGFAHTVADPVRCAPPALNGIP